MGKYYRINNIYLQEKQVGYNGNDDDDEWNNGMNDHVVDNDNFHWTFTIGYVLCYSLTCTIFLNLHTLRLGLLLFLFYRELAGEQRFNWITHFMQLVNDRARIVS